MKLNHEDAAIGLDRFALEIEALCKRMDRFAADLPVDWLDRFNDITELHVLDQAPAKMKRLADDIYQEGEAEIAQQRADSSMASSAAAEEEQRP